MRVLFVSTIRLRSPSTMHILDIQVACVFVSWCCFAGLSHPDDSCSSKIYLTHGSACVIINVY